MYFSSSSSTGVGLEICISLTFSSISLSIFSISFLRSTFSSTAFSKITFKSIENSSKNACLMISSQCFDFKLSYNIVFGIFIFKVSSIHIYSTFFFQPSIAGEILFNIWSTLSQFFFTISLLDLRDRPLYLIFIFISEK